MTRAFLVGIVLWGAMLLYPGVHVMPRHPGAVLWFGLFGSTFLALAGVMTSIWAEKFDHAAAITNFVIGPLTLLSGTFYSVEALTPMFRSISHLNPFFYIISGFRYGFLERADLAGAAGRGGDPRGRYRDGGRLLRAAALGMEAEELTNPRQGRYSAAPGGPVGRPFAF